MHKSVCLLAFAAALAFLTSPASPQAPPPVTKLPIAELQKLADSGDPTAQNELGIRYRAGDGVDKDPAKAVLWYLKAARQGYVKSYFNLGAAYYNGDGVPVNDEESCMWFLLAADAGDPLGQEAVERAKRELPAQKMLRCELLTASGYETGEVAKQDYGRAMQWYTVAANVADGSACERIAYLYHRGLGVMKDNAKALTWLKRSADLGYAPGMYELARAYDIGETAPHDPGEAKVLYSKAKKLFEAGAADRKADALLGLGNMYAEGRGTKANPERALMYYILAAHYGSHEAERQVGALAAQLTPEQVASAKKHAVKFANVTRFP